MDLYKYLGIEIRRVRKDRDFSEEALGREAEIDPNPKYIGEIEIGNANITIKTLFKIANALNITVGGLLSFTLITEEPIDVQNDAIEIAKILRNLGKNKREI